MDKSAGVIVASTVLPGSLWKARVQLLRLLVSPGWCRVGSEGTPSAVAGAPVPAPAWGGTASLTTLPLINITFKHLFILVRLLLILDL